MIVLIAWVVALVIAGLMLGIVGFALFGAARRLQQAAGALRTDVVPRAQNIRSSVAPRETGGRHSIIRR